jgi:hypothetical protein
MADKKFFVSKEELERRYCECGSLAMVAKECGVSKKLILNYMNRYEIPRITRDSQIVADEIDFRAMDGWDSKRIAASMNLSLVTVNRYLKKSKVAVLRYHKGYIVTQSGYVMIFNPGHANADKKGYVRKHILLMSEKIGRPVLDYEVVHHIDEDKGNNDIANLQLMTKFEHKSLHSRKPRKRNI